MSKIIEFELKSVLRFGLTYEQICAYDILCLPENLESVINKDDIFDASDSILLSKLLKATGIRCANSFDLQFDAQVLERRSKDKWFGTIYIRNNVVIPIFVGVLYTLIANDITDVIKSNEQPIPKVHIELKFEKPNNVTTLKYEGDAQTLITILKGIEEEDKQKAIK
jgi:hypothetical protein